MNKTTEVKDETKNTSNITVVIVEEKCDHQKNITNGKVTETNSTSNENGT